MKLPATFETEVFMNARGAISIVQREYPHEEVIVALSRHQAVLVAQELLRLASDESNWTESDSEDAD